MKETADETFHPVDISEEDVIEAMKRIPGYIDVTPGDFKEVYQTAYSLAMSRLFNSMTAANIMSTPVFLVNEEMALVEAAHLLAEKQISGGPVVDRDGRVVGVISEKDFLKEMGLGSTPSFMQIVTHCLDSKGCMIGELRNRNVGDIMTRPPITADSKITIGTISSFFAEHQINRLPIIDGNGRPVGIVTRTDLAHSFHALQERSAS